MTLLMQALLPFLSVFHSIFFTYFWYYSGSTLKSATCIKSIFLKDTCKSSELTHLKFSLVVLECAVKSQPTKDESIELSKQEHTSSSLLPDSA